MNNLASIRPNDLLILASNSIRHNKLRSILTIGAVAVGIGVMVYLISMGFGMEKMTLGEVAKSNALLSITVRSPVEKLPLDAKAVQKITNISGAKEVLPKLSARGQISLDNQTAATTIVGADSGYLELTDVTQLAVGNYYRDQDAQAMVVTTGFLKLFGLETSKVPLVPFDLTIDPQDFPGLPKMKDIAARGVVQDDAVVAYLPRAYLEKVFTDSKLIAPNYEDIKIKVATLADTDRVQKELIAQGFRVETVAQTMAQIQNVFFWIRLILAMLGLVAIIVASIGMFNTLTISLLERTREIGIMKALGVRRSDISRIFLVEAFLMGALGGVGGLVIALVFQQVTLFILSLLASLSINGNVPELFLNHWYILVGAMLFAVLVALATGFYPSRRAAHLNPIDAMRYE